MTVLGARHVSRVFGTTRAVDDVSFEVRAGEVVGLLGANGAGKTTLIRMLLGLLPTSAGEVTLLGGSPDRDRRRRMGYVPQGLGLYGDLTVAENLAFVAGAYGVAAPVPAGRLADRAATLVADLPLGLQRELSFVAALAHGPDVLVLDEPTSGVDPLARAALWDTIREEADRGVGVLVTTHYLQEAGQCDRLLLLSQCGLVAQGSEADVVAGTTALSVRADRWAEAFAVLDAAGEPVLLSGRAIRVAGGDPERVRGLLAAHGLPARVDSVPGTIEERMLLLARAGAA